MFFSLSFTSKKGSPCLDLYVFFPTMIELLLNLWDTNDNTLRRASYTFFLIRLMSAVVNCKDSIFSPTSFKIIVFTTTEGASTVFRLHTELTIGLDIVFQSYGLCLCHNFSRRSCTTTLFTVNTSITISSNISPTC